MNLYGYPSVKSEITLATAWAASARAEGHRQKFPEPPTEGKRKIPYKVKDSDRAAVLQAIGAGHQTAGAIARAMILGRMVTAATLANLLEAGRVKRRKVKTTFFYSLAKN